MRSVLAAIALLLGSPAEGAPAQKPTRFAAWSIRAVSGVTPATASVLSEVIAAELSRVTGAQVMSAADVTAILGFDRQRQALGCSEARCLAELGGALKVDYLVTGQVGAMGSRYHLSLTLVDSAKGSVVNRVAGFCDPTEDALAAAAQSGVAALVRQLAGDAAPAADAKPALDSETDRDLLARADARRPEAPAEAAALYDDYLRRFAGGKDRCTALMLGGVSWDAAKEPGKAADRFVSFALDGCAAQTPDLAAKLLHRASGMYSDLGRRADARRATQALVTLSGVTDAAMLRKIDSARLRLRAQSQDPTGP